MEQVRSPDPNGPYGSLLACTIRGFIDLYRDFRRVRGRGRAQTARCVSMRSDPARDACYEATVRQVRGSWCRRRDLNPHGLRHTPLKRACLPFHHFGYRQELEKLPQLRSRIAQPLNVLSRTPRAFARCGLVAGIFEAPAPRSQNRPSL